MRSGFRLLAVGGGLWSDPEAVPLTEIAWTGSTPPDLRSIRSPFSAVRPTARFSPTGVRTGRWNFCRGVRGSDGTAFWPSATGS
jgi:hypothetical protein